MYAGDQMRAAVDRRRELGPGLVRALGPADPAAEVGRRVPGLESGGIDGRLGPLVEQADGGRADEAGVEECVEPPPSPASLAVQQP